QRPLGIPSQRRCGPCGLELFSVRRIFEEAIRIPGAPNPSRARSVQKAEGGAMTAPEPLQLHVSRLKDGKPNVRVRAAKALGEIGPAAAPAIPDLAELLRDEDVSVRLAAVTALGEIGPAAKEAVPILIEALQDADAEISAAAVTALGQLREAA